METDIAVLIGFFFALVIGSLAYAIFRLVRSKKQSGLDPKSLNLGRAVGAPKLFYPLLARTMTSREKWGWLVFLVITVAAIAFTGK